MADTPISGLTQATPVAADYVEILDVSDTAMGASGSNRKALLSAVLAVSHSQAWSTITSTPTTLSGYGITDAITAAAVAAGYQPLDPELTAIAGLTSAADRLPYFTGSGSAALATFTTFGRSLVDDADAAAARTTLGLGTAATTASTDYAAASHTQAWSTITSTPTTLTGYGITDAQPLANTLTALSVLAPLDDECLPYYTSGSAAALATFTAFARTLLDDADAAAARTTLGLAIGTNVQAYDADLAAIAGLADPNADRILFWDDSAGAYAYLSVGSGLSITDTTLATTGGGGGTPTAITVADESSDTTCFPLFVTAATGDLGPRTNSGLAFNSSTGTLTATAFSGPLTGNVTGNASGSSGSCTGNAATATALQTGRAINGVTFDGTAAITVTAAAGTLTGTTLASGVTASSLTSVGTLTGGATGAGFTIALGSSTVTGTVAKANGGTGEDNSTGGTQNTFWARPNGSTGAASYRAIVAADIPTLNQSTTGSAATLTTARAIYGNNFDGSAALTQVIASTYGGTGNGFTKFTGPTTSEKTFTLPNADSTIVVQGGALGTPSSGTLTNCTGLPTGGLVDAAVTLAKMADLATQRVVGRNTGSTGVPEAVTASQVVDWIGSTRGSVLYRGASGWAALTPGTAGYAIVSGGAGADPAYALRNVTSTGAAGSEPGSPQAGDLYLPSGGFSVGRYSGSAWEQWGPVFKFADPTTQSFSWVNQSGASETTVGKSLVLTDTTAGGLRCRVKTAPSTPYTITAAFLAQLYPVAFPACGLLFRESSSGKLHTWCVEYTTSSSVNYWGAKNNKFTDASTFSASYTADVPIPTGHGGSVFWLRIADNGTNRIVSYSANGVTWTQRHSIGRTDFLTANQVGFFIVTSASGPSSMTLLSWEEG